MDTAYRRGKNMSIDWELFRQNLRSSQAKDLKDYIEKAVKRLLGFEDDLQLFCFLSEQNESSSPPNASLSGISEEEKEAIYRAVTNRLYYSYYQFFRWYFWKEELNVIAVYDNKLRTHVLHGTEGMGHGGLPKTIQNEIPPLLASSEVRPSGEELKRWARTLYNYRKHADYHLEVEFGDEEFETVLQCYRKLRRVMEALPIRPNI